MDSFFVALNAITPFLFHLLFGALARLSGVVPDAIFPLLNKIVFRLLFPVLMFTSTAGAGRDGGPSWGLMLFLVAAITATAGIASIIVPRIVRDDSRAGVIIHAIFRSNFVVLGLTLGESVVGDSIISAMSAIIVGVVTLYNIYGALVIERFGGRGLNGGGALGTLAGLARNPMLQGSAAGLLFAALDLELPACIARPVQSWSALTTPFALFVLGGSLRLSRVAGDMRYILPTLAARLIVVPALGLAAAAALGFRGAELFCAFAVFATPCAMAIFPMTQNMGGDANLAGEMVVVCTIASVFTMFGWIFVMSLTGLV